MNQKANNDLRTIPMRRQSPTMYVLVVLRTNSYRPFGYTQSSFFGGTLLKLGSLL